jgi:hypothetical protein
MQIGRSLFADSGRPNVGTEKQRYRV